MTFTRASAAAYFCPAAILAERRARLLAEKEFPRAVAFRQGKKRCLRQITQPPRIRRIKIARIHTAVRLDHNLSLAGSRKAAGGDLTVQKKLKDMLQLTE